MEYRALQGSSDEQLMIHLQAGHHDALAVIVDRYQRLVWSVAKRIVHDGGEAEDVVQIVFLELFKKWIFLTPNAEHLKCGYFNSPTRKASIGRSPVSKFLNMRRPLENSRMVSRSAPHFVLLKYRFNVTPPTFQSVGLQVGQFSRL